MNELPRVYQALFGLLLVQFIAVAWLASLTLQSTTQIQDLTQRSLVQMEDIAELYGNMGSVQNLVSLIVDFDTRIDATVRALQSNETDLLGTISSLQENLSALESQKADLEYDVSKLQTDLKEYINMLEELSEQVEQLQGRVEDLEFQLWRG